MTILFRTLTNDINGNPRFNIQFMGMVEFTKKGIFRKCLGGSFNLASYNLIDTIANATNLNKEDIILVEGN